MKRKPVDYKINLVSGSMDEMPHSKKNLLLFKIKVATLLDNEMKRRNMSRKALATKMNFGKDMVTSWLSGTHNFTIETLFKLEEVLNITIIDVNS